MPTYEYRCPEGHEFEKFVLKISDAKADLPCPACGLVAPRRMSAGSGFLFKGSGFYITDYGKDGKKDQRDAATAAAAKGSDATADRAKSDSAKADGAKAAGATSGGSGSEGPAESSKGPKREPAATKAEAPTAKPGSTPAPKSGPEK
jgi:putative FmdB family regulatory protein